MAIPRFFVNNDIDAGSTGTLSPEQTRQARSVLRLGVGATMILVDGSGAEATARVVAPGGRGSTLLYEIQSVAWPDREPPLRLTVGLALLKGDRFDLAAQKLTELGVATIAPLLTERCVVSYDDARGWEQRAERLRRVVIEAVEQSERVTLPNIAAPVTLDTFLAARPAVALVERAAARSIASLPLASVASLAVGPEGGWSEREAALIERQAAGVASLGELILRAETAAIVAAGTLIQRAWATRD